MWRIYKVAAVDMIQEAPAQQRGIVQLSRMKGSPRSNCYVTPSTNRMESWGSELRVVHGGGEVVWFRFGESVCEVRALRLGGNTTRFSVSLSNALGLEREETKAWQKSSDKYSASFLDMDHCYGRYSYLMAALVYQWENPSRPILGGGSKSCCLASSSSLLSAQLQLKSDYRIELRVLALAGGMSVTSDNKVRTPIGDKKLLKGDGGSMKAHFGSGEPPAGWHRVNVSALDIYMSRLAVRGYSGDGTHDYSRGECLNASGL